MAVSVDLALEEGGDGVAEVELARVSSSDVTVHDVRVQIRLPRVVSSRGVTGVGWRCQRKASLLRCSQARRAIAAGGVPVLKLYLDTGPRGGATGARDFGRGSLAATAWWSELAGTRLRRMRAVGRVTVQARRPLAVIAGAPDRTVGDGVRGSEPVPVVLTGVVSNLTRAPARYSWRQLCPPRGAACARVRFDGRRAGDVTSPDIATSFVVPQVAHAQTLRFELAASDARGTATATVSVRVVPEEVDRIAPRLGTTGIADRLLAPQHERLGEPVPLASGDRAQVDIGRPGPLTVRAGALVRLQGDVRGESEERVAWTVVDGPRGLLASARRRGTAISFFAPLLPQTLIVRMTAWTADGRFTDDKLMFVVRAASALPAFARGSSSSAHAAAGQDPQTLAFCRVVADARKSGRVSIELDSGERFDAKTAVEPSTGTCSGTETVSFTGGSSQLGDFRLADLGGTVTRSGGLKVLTGMLQAPDFWSVGAGRPSLAFRLPDQIVEGVRVGVGARLAADGTWGNLAGELVLSRESLAKLPIVGALPAGWRMESVRLAVDPSAGRFELSAQARGPSSASQDATLAFDGSLSFDGSAGISVLAANLAVLQSPYGQTTVSAQGRLDLLPGTKFDPARKGPGSFFPVVDVAVSASIRNYRPAPGLSLDGEISWSTSGPLQIAGTLVASVKGEDLTAAVAGSYRNASDWSLEAALRSQTGFRIGGLFTLSTLEGSVTRSGVGIAIKLKGGVRDARGIGGVTLREATATLTNSGCDFEGPLQTARLADTSTAAKPVCLVVNGKVDLRIPGRAEPLPVEGGLVVDLATLRFSVSGGVSSNTSFGPDLFKLSSVRVWATNTPAAQAVCGARPAEMSTRPARGPPASGAADASLSFGFSAKGHLLGLELTDVAGAYTAGGEYCLSATVAPANLPGGNGDGSDLKPVPPAAGAECNVAGAPALQGLRLKYSSVDRVASLSGGRFCLPERLRKILGPIGQGTGTVHLKITLQGEKPGIEGRFTYTLPQSPLWLIGASDDTGTKPDPAKAALGLKSVAFAFNAGTTGVALQLDAAGALRMPNPNPQQFGPGAGSAEAPLNVAATAQLGKDPGFTLTTTLGTVPAVCTEQKAVFRNLFGQQGLNICSLGLAGTLGPAPSLAATASFTLPGAWTRELGISNAAYYIGFNVSAANPCLDLAIDQIDKTKPAIDMFNKGVLTANKVHLTIAPTGCRLPESASIPGQLSRELPAGFKIAFEGLIAKTPVKLNVALELRGQSFKFNAHLDIASWQAGPVAFGATTIKVLLDPSTSTYSIGVKTSAKLGDGQFSIDVNFESSGTGTARKVSLQGTGDLSFKLAGASFKGRMTFSFQTSQAGTTASFSGHFTLDLVVFRASVKIRKLDYDGTKGGLQYLDVSAQAAAGSKFGPAELSADGAVYYSRAENKLRLNFNFKFRLWRIFTINDHRAFELGPISLPFRIGVPGGRVTVPLFVVPGTLQLRGAIAGALTWSPNAGFGVRITEDFSFHYCAFGGCPRLAGASVNRDTGVVTVRILGIPITIRPQQYA